MPSRAASSSRRESCMRAKWRCQIVELQCVMKVRRSDQARSRFDIPRVGSAPTTCSVRVGSVAPADSIFSQKLHASGSYTAAVTSNADATWAGCRLSQCISVRSIREPQHAGGMIQADESDPNTYVVLFSYPLVVCTYRKPCELLQHASTARCRVC
jgi:hypothetical protein